MADPIERSRTRAEALPPRGLNVLLITVDQERFFDQFPFPVPGRERLLREAISFVRHQINATVCTPSRAVLYTGFHMPQTGMFDNVSLPWMRRSLDPSLGTLANLLDAAGYHCAYYGKWHLSSAMEGGRPSSLAMISTPDFHAEMLRYGFADYYGFGDYIGRSQGGYQFDSLTTAQAISWLRGTGRTLTSKQHPWFLVVSLVNPHDVMHIDTDEAGERVQWLGSTYEGAGISMDPAQPPAHDVYRASWDHVSLPESRHQPVTDLGRPHAHVEYQQAHGALVGAIPDEDRRWRKLQDYYFNCIRDCDAHLVTILDELDRLGLRDKTIIVFTSDHGELGGHHGLHGKGPTIYKEQMQVPLFISHPAFPGGKRCPALSSHLDLAPTLVALTGLSSEEQARILGDRRKGKDLSGLFADPERAGPHAVRDAILSCYSMILYADAKYTHALAALTRRGDLTAAQKAAAMTEIHPDLSKRSAIRCIDDGEHKFARYFSLVNHNMPADLEQLYANNDVELFEPPGGSR